MTDTEKLERAWDDALLAIQDSPPSVIRAGNALVAALKEKDAEIERLRAAIETIANQYQSDEWETDGNGEPLGDVTEGYDGIIDIARAALEQK